MNRLLVFSAFILLIIPLGINFASARTWDVTIPSGAADSTNSGDRFFYSPWDLTVGLYDTVQWGNGDTASHTVTSGDPKTGPDGVFDSTLFGPGKTFSYKFVKEGVYKYFCQVHPWMTGMVTVQLGEALNTLHGVGSDAGDGKTIFDVRYQLEKTLLKAEVDQKGKAVTFSMAGKGNNGDLFIVELPKGLISGNLEVWIDYQNSTDFKVQKSEDSNTLTIPITAKTETVTVLGDTVVPEFGPIAILVFAVAIIGFVIASGKMPNLFRTGI